MKIEQILVQHLYNTKQLRLQGIGTFHLNGTVPLSTENDKDFTIPEKAIEFEYNLKAVEDETLIDFIAKQTGKIKPLAQSDLDSYVILSKQFLNIGKPLTIDGIGTIQKNQQGDYEFIPGVFITPKIDDIPRQLREKRDESVSFESERNTPKSKKSILVAIVLLALAIGGVAIYYLLHNQKNTEPATPVVASTPVVDTPKAVVKDTAIQPPVAVIDSTKFKVVIREYTSREAAEKAYTKFTSFGHNLVLYTKDSVTYKLAMPFTRKLADTLIVKDSLKIFFLGKPYIELQ